MLLSQAKEVYLSHTVLSELTVRNYEKAFRSFIGVIGDVDIKKITIKHITEFESALNGTTKYNYLMTLRAFFKFMQLKFDIKCLDYRKIDPQKRKTRSWTNQSTANIALILKSFKKTQKDLRDKALIHTLFSTGCRSFEALNMKIDELDCINLSYDVKGKGGKFRTVYFTPQALKDVQNYLDTRDDDCPSLFITSNGTGYNTSQPRQMSSSNLRMLFWRLSKEFGFRIHSHQFRKSFATETEKQSGDIYKVSKLLGHSSVDTTAKYAIVEEEELKEFHQRYFGKNREFILQEKESGRVRWEIKGFVAEGQPLNKIKSALRKAMDEAMKCAIFANILHLVCDNFGILIRGL